MRKIYKLCIGIALSAIIVACADKLDSDKYFKDRRPLEDVFTDKENILSINIGNFSPLVISLLSKFFADYPVSSDNIYFFFPTCDVLTISNIITLNSERAKNIYMADCSPTLLNPSIFTTFRKLYNVKLTNDVYQDLSSIRQK